MHTMAERNAYAPKVTGLNDNLDFLGRQLHIQTESMEAPTAHIATQVFSNGRVLYSKKLEYPPALCESRNPEKIRELMQVQHLQVIQEIKDKQNRVQRNP